MKASNIVLAVLAGAAIGGIVAIVLKAENTLFEDSNDDENGNESSAFERIANQFSEKFSSELKTAEHKLNSVVQRNTGLLKPDEQDGVFL